MNEALSSLTFDWLLPRVLGGIAAGYVLRVLEHVIYWSRNPKPEEGSGHSVNFALMILPQSILFGVTVGFVLLALVALYFQNANVINISAVALPALMSFLAGDLRGLLKRISRI